MEPIFHRGYAWLAAVLIAACLGQAVHILFFKDPVTVWDAFFAVLLAVLIYKTKTYGKTNLESGMIIKFNGAAVML